MRNYHKVNAYWWVGKPNFGDAVAPYLLERFANCARIAHSPIETANVVTVGSVLEHIPAGWQGFVLGSGCLYPDRKLNLGPRVLILGLRGPLSAARWSPWFGDIAIGDPGLLADELVGSQSREYDLGIVPHWSDNELANDPRFVGHKWSTAIINPGGDPLKVIQQIGQCKKIVTSSLHGLIVADAFGIPRRFEYTSRFDREGKLFKFQDYSASIGATFEVGKLSQPNSHMIDDRKHELWDAYRELGKVLRH